MADLHTPADYVLKFKQGTRSNLEKRATTHASVQGEPHYATDTYQLFISTGTALEMKPVQSLDMAVFFEDEIVSFNDEAVYNF